MVVCLREERLFAEQLSLVQREQHSVWFLFLCGRLDVEKDLHVAALQEVQHLLLRLLMLLLRGTVALLSLLLLRLLLLLVLLLAGAFVIIVDVVLRSVVIINVLLILVRRAVACSTAITSGVVDNLLRAKTTFAQLRR